MQSRPQIQERIQEINKKLEELKSELNTLEQQKQPLKAKLQRFMQNKEAQKSQNRIIIKNMSTKLESVKADHNNIQRLTNELDILEPLDLSNAIKAHKVSLKTSDDQLTEKVSFLFLTNIKLT